MLFARINRANPEKVFVVAKNSYSTAALSNGQAVTWDFVTDADGVGVTMPLARATNAGTAIAGVAAEAISVGEYGLIQCWGYHSAVVARNATGGSPAMEAGSPLAVNAAGSVFALENFATGSVNLLVFPCGFAYGSTAGWTTSTIAAHLKAL